MDEFRKRRAHRKSKRGCEQCRKRRVKCDETLPRCSACIRRHEPCKRRLESPVWDDDVCQPAPTPGIGPVSARAAAPALAGLLGAPGSVVNLQHMKLFHHFQHHTASTMLFPVEVWTHIVQVAVEFEALMHAVLCTAARHLAYLTPGDPSYPLAASTHLAETLRLFRRDLGGEFDASNVDAFMATAALLHIEMWINTDFVLPGSDGEDAEYGPAEDYLFRPSLGATHVFIRSAPYLAAKPSVFLPQIASYSPRSILIQAAQLSRTALDSFQSVYAYEAPLHRDLLTLPGPFTRGTNLVPKGAWATRFDELHMTTDPVDAYNEVLPRLFLILAFLPETQPQPADAASARSPAVQRALARYVSIFPLLCPPAFLELVRAADPHALVLLYHFYRAAGVLLSADDGWWALDHAHKAERALAFYLTRICVTEEDAA